MDKDPDIFVKGVSKTFKQGGETLQVLRNVDFQANTGELVMIVGPSGSGKTTLLSAIAGTLSVESGVIRLFNFSLNLKSRREIIDFRRQKIGFIFQQFHLIPSLTCAENVAIPMILNGCAYSEALKAAHKSLEEVDLGDKFASFPRDLSGGQQQRVAIARSLIHQPLLIICDEFTLLSNNRKLNCYFLKSPLNYPLFYKDLIKESATNFLLKQLRANKYYGPVLTNEFKDNLLIAILKTLMIETVSYKIKCHLKECLTVLLEDDGGSFIKLFSKS